MCGTQRSHKQVFGDEQREDREGREEGQPRPWQRRLLTRHTVHEEGNIRAENRYKTNRAAPRDAQM
jgi:hypothetical protein